jgi:phosphatidylglycerophosphatase A
MRDGCELKNPLYPRRRADIVFVTRLLRSVHDKEVPLFQIARFIGTFGFTGFFPVFPATFASAVFVAVYWFVPGGEHLAHPLVFAVTAVISVPVSTALEKKYGHDPGCVVIDEVVGMQAILVGAARVGAWGIVLAFALFRVFDIAKPFPVGRAQRLPRGWGVVVDDVLAGAYTRVALILISLLFPSIGRFSP